MRILIVLFFIISIIDLQSEYKLDSDVDFVLMPLSVVSASVGNIMTYQDNPLTEDDFAGIDNLNIPFFDRWNTTYRSIYADISDVLLSFQLFSPLSYSFSSEFSKDFQTNSVIYFETISLNYGLNSITKSLAKRFRPFSYDTNSSNDLIYNYDTQYSFYSGHSSTAFASAVFNILILTDKGDFKYKDITIALNLVNASAIATLRILAGKHFLSDVLVGAIVGSGIAYAVTELHSNSKQPQISEFNPIRFRFTLPI